MLYVFLFSLLSMGSVLIEDYSYFLFFFHILFLGLGFVLALFWKLTAAAAEHTIQEGLTF